MTDTTKPSLVQLAEEFHLDPVADIDEPQAEDPRTEEGSSAGAQLRRTTRLMVNDNLRSNMGGNGPAV